MELMERVLRFRWGVAILSSIVSVASGVAIVAFGAPPATFILASWALASVYLTVKARVNRRVGRW
jgi:hypothetical protein